MHSIPSMNELFRGMHFVSRHGSNAGNSRSRRAQVVPALTSRCANLLLNRHNRLRPNGLRFLHVCKRPAPFCKLASRPSSGSVARATRFLKHAANLAWFKSRPGRVAKPIVSLTRTSSPLSPAAPRPSAPHCKLALIGYEGHCTPMSYVVFRVCKRARQLCKLASSPSRVAPVHLCHLVLPSF